MIENLNPAHEAKAKEEAEAKRQEAREEALKKSAECLAQGRFVEAISWKNRAYAG